MASPMTPDEFLAALHAEGVRVTEHTGWRTHNRAGHGAWGPVNGVVIHHTAGTGPSDGEIVWAGRPDLPGPLAHGYLAKTGTVTMTANGRANHAGGGDPAVLTAVMGEAYLTAPPAPREHDGSAGAVDGNARFYGLEISNLGTGKDPYPAAQYDAAVRWAAAICRHHGWSAKSVIAHSEWSDWKNDPSFPITQFRADVAARLAHPANWLPSTTTPEEEDMPTAAEIAKAVADHTEISPTSKKATRAGAYWAYADARHAQVMAQLGALTGLVTQLAAGGGLTAAQATAAAEAGAKAALAELGHALTD